MPSQKLNFRTDVLVEVQTRMLHAGNDRPGHVLAMVDFHQSHSVQ